MSHFFKDIIFQRQLSHQLSEITPETLDLWSIYLQYTNFSSLQQLHHSFPHSPFIHVRLFLSSNKETITLDDIFIDYPQQGAIFIDGKIAILFHHHKYTLLSPYNHPKYRSLVDNILALLSNQH